MKLIKYLKKYTKEAILGPLFKLFEATLELIVPLVVASIIDKGIAEGDTPYIVKMSLILVLLGAIGLAFSLTAQYFAAKASVGFVTGIRNGLFKHIQTLTYSDIDRIGTPTLITRMTTDASRVQTGLNLALRLLLRSPFVVFGAMIMALSIDTSAGTTFAVVIPILSVIVFGIMLITTPLYKKVQSGIDKILKRTRENLSGVRVIRAFAREENEVRDFREENAALTAAQKRAGHVSALLNPLTYIIINIGILYLIYVGALKVDSGDLTQGEVIALYNYMSQILVELIKLANLIVSITRALASASRISSAFDIKSTQEYGSCEMASSDGYAVELRGVSLRYAGSPEDALTDISFTASRGETVGIIGGTGSGKSSLVNLIARFYDASEGEVLINGRCVKEYTKDAITRAVGIVEQKATLFSGSIRDNIRLGAPDATDEEIYEALKVSQALDLSESHGGLDAEVASGGKNFSGGQRQRLTIARALAKKPEILILDDSSSALDYATDARLRTSIKALSGERTVFIVSQRTASVMHADKIIVLDDGCAVDIGTHDELLTRSTVYREIYESQFKKEASV
ncbi:MAG: ABC transporter ATP-binding protein [Clostridia bacterium]|nr:ABC transporter ATP-binding protein [Clostridia bacterium]